jgi:hypothetical protein
MKQGKRTPAKIREFIISAKESSPELTHLQIADRVTAKFGEENQVDRSTVGRILKGASLNATPPSPQMSSIDIREHWERLSPVILDLKGIGQFPDHVFDLGIWFSRPHVLNWPVPKGRMWREQDGSFRLRLDAEDSVEWKYLEQHLENTTLWEAIDEFHIAMALDTEARFKLLERIKYLVQLPIEEGGTGLVVVDHIGYGDEAEPKAGLYYVFTIYDQVLSQAVELPLQVKEPREFLLEPPNRVQLGDHRVLCGPDPDQLQAAVDWLLKAQQELVQLSETKSAAEAYSRANRAAQEVTREIDEIRLRGKFPEGSRCRICLEYLPGC